MMMTRTELDGALEKFIKAFRLYIVAQLKVAYGGNWFKLFLEGISPQQKENIHKSNPKTEVDKIDCIDYQHLKSISLKHKDLLKEDFKKDISKLPTWLEEIAEVRNKWGHFEDLTPKEIRRAVENMEAIAQLVGMTDLADYLAALHEPGGVAQAPPVVAINESPPVLQPVRKVGSGRCWFDIVIPHQDIQDGNLEEAIFAANLGEVAEGQGRAVYTNANAFFEKTYLTEGLKHIARRVVKGLNGALDAGDRVISLQTGFGGGKTHTLVALLHIAQHGNQLEKVAKELTTFTGPLAFPQATCAVFTNTTNNPATGRYVPGGPHIRTLWGEIAYRLGGEAAYELVRANDENRSAPKGLFKQVLAQYAPALILIDELADYCVAASSIAVGNSTLSEQTISFIQELTQAVVETPACVLVATLPESATEMGGDNAYQILKSLENRFGRVGADIKPVSDDEIYEVIRRRLFESVGDPGIIQSVAESYCHHYQTLSNELPVIALQNEYKIRLKAAYPFHPELIAAFQIRWASHHGFQRTRGILRILAAIIGDLWKRRNQLPPDAYLIHTSDVDFARIDPLRSLLTKLFGTGYDSVISADVAGPSSNAFLIDAEQNRSSSITTTVMQGVAATILLDSFGGQSAHRGVGLDELKLSVVRPESFNHNEINTALDKLEAVAHYLYSSSLGGTRRFWFLTKPNLNILINKARNEVVKSEIHTEIIQRLEKKKGELNKFCPTLINPNAGEVPEQKTLTLIILHPRFQSSTRDRDISSELKAEVAKIAMQRGNSARVFRNTLLFLAPTEIGYARLEKDVTEYRACKKVEVEYGSALDKEQKEELKKRMDDAVKLIEKSFSTAYCLVLKHTAKEGPRFLEVRSFSDNLETHIKVNVWGRLKDDEWLLGSIGFLLFQEVGYKLEGEAQYPCQDIYEAFLRFDAMPMITGKEAISKSLALFCERGNIAIAIVSPDGEPDKNGFTRYYYKEPVAITLDENTPNKQYVIPPSRIIQPPTVELEDTPAQVVNSQTNTPATYAPHSYAKPLNQPSKPIEPPTQIKTLQISGKVSPENYTDLFSCFITPLRKNKNSVEIFVEIKCKTSAENPLKENSSLYSDLKESAQQLGLDFIVEVK